MQRPVRTWVSHAVTWIATRLRNVFGWRQDSTPKLSADAPPTEVRPVPDDAVAATDCGPAAVPLASAVDAVLESAPPEDSQLPEAPRDVLRSPESFAPAEELPAAIEPLPVLRLACCELLPPPALAAGRDGVGGPATDSEQVIVPLRPPSLREGSRPSPPTGGRVDSRLGSAPNTSADEISAIAPPPAKLLSDEVNEPLAGSAEPLPSEPAELSAAEAPLVAATETAADETQPDIPEPVDEPSDSPASADPAACFSASLLVEPEFTEAVENLGPIEVAPAEVEPSPAPTGELAAVEIEPKPATELPQDLIEDAPPTTGDPPAAVPANAAAEGWPGSMEHAERLIALIEGPPIACGSEPAGELARLLADEEFDRVAELLAGSDRTFDDLRLPAAKHIYGRIMASPFRPREPARFREPVHDLAILQALYRALRIFSDQEGVPLSIRPGGRTATPSGVLVHAPWWTCDALDQELKAPDPDIRATNGRVLARWFRHLEPDILLPSRIGTLTATPKLRKKVVDRGYDRDDAAVASPDGHPPVDVAVLAGEGTVPTAAIWLRGQTTVSWTIRMAMLRGTRILDLAELDRVRREVEVTAWQRDVRRGLLAAVASYIEDPRGYDAGGVRKRLARRADDALAGTPFADSDEHRLFDAWRHARHDMAIPFDRSIGRPSVDVLAADMIAQIAPPFCARLGMEAPPPG